MKSRTSRPRPLARWAHFKNLTLEGWGLTPLRRKFFPHLHQLTHRTHSQSSRYKKIRQESPNHQYRRNHIQGGRWV